MNKLTVGIVAVALVCSGTAAATTHGELDVGPGVVGPASPIYGLELAVDNAAMSVGLADAGGIVQERAAEASVAASNGNPDAAARAAGSAAAVAQRADSEDDVDGVERAMGSLNSTVTMMETRAENAPNEEARAGMLTAVENMERARSNMEQAADRRAAQERSGQSQSDARAP
jgi:hypothetical protein